MYIKYIYIQYIWCSLGGAIWRQSPPPPPPPPSPYSMIFAKLQYIKADVPNLKHRKMSPSLSFEKRSPPPGNDFLNKKIQISKTVINIRVSFIKQHWKKLAVITLTQ